MTTVFYTYLDSLLPQDKFTYYLSYLDEASQQKILRFRRTEDQQASLLGKMLLLKGLLYFGYTKAVLNEIKYTKYERPFINLPIDFNISHSGKIIICAITNNGKVGIDIEKIRPVKIGDFRNIFSIGEYNSILNSENSYNRFFNIWTRKEAVIKANGQGLYIPLQNILVKNDTVALYNDTWYLKDIFLDDEYSSSMATSYRLEINFLMTCVNKEEFNFT